MFKTFLFRISCRSINAYCSVVAKSRQMSCSKMIKSSDVPKAKDCRDDSSPVYILSRINGLFESIEDLKVELCPELVVKKIDLPDESDSLSLEAIDQVKNIEILLADPKPLAKNHQVMPKLKWAHCTWAGVEPIFDVIKEKPDFILTRHSDEDFCEQMAEFVMAQVLIYEKQFISVWEGREQRNWEKMSVYAHNAKNRRLKYLTLAVLGVGNMGMCIAKYFKPHGTKVIGLGRRPRSENECGFFDRIDTSLENVLSVADYIINTLPSTPETIGLLNGMTFKACKRKPVFINVGRGNIVKELFLIEALEKGWLSHAILDVFETEPLPADSKLWPMTDKVTITPHCAAISEQKQVARNFLTHFMQYQQKCAFARNHIVDWENKY